ncbi:MAG: saccharopine dehydrogenase NADP-binding domain-containing protein [Bacteroidales bacterium]|nr:saccharopine dehydrogenase NADP-binding domain-containing protein [Bacteroidales bacterium]MCF8454397.1 saccharopine dehydrogenase NADP-binding domain-containing protein [Bacteroidales bacterium]
MKNILLLGAGLSSTSLIGYLLKNSTEYNWKITIGDVYLDTVQKKINGHPNATALKFDVTNPRQLEVEVGKTDLVISMLPARMHHLVATQCLKFGKNLITASYVSKEVKQLEGDVKNKGLLFLNEIGVDPGIDHMSAMKVIHKIEEEGGKLLSFKSSTGGLVAPEYDNNPWQYKLTWNPRNVVLAGQGISMYIKNGRYKYIPYHKLFQRLETTEVLNVGTFEVYPNRDSLKYRSTYGLENIPTIFRGTMRRPGYCKAWDIFVQLGMTNDDFIVENSEELTYREFINSFVAYDRDSPVEEKIAKYVGLETDSPEMKKLIWLGLFENEPIGLKNVTPAQILQHKLEEKWQLGPNDKDMIVMQHQFEYEKDGLKKGIKSSLVVMGIDKLQTAMSITVGTPVAIAAKLILTGKLKKTGVVIPVEKDVYTPILTELEDYGIRFVEEEFEVRS